MLSVWLTLFSVSILKQFLSKKGYLQIVLSKCNINAEYRIIVFLFRKLLIG